MRKKISHGGKKSFFGLYIWFLRSFIPRPRERCFFSTWIFFGFPVKTTRYHTIRTLQVSILNQLTVLCWANFYFEVLGRRWIPTWQFSNLHVENKKSPRGYEMKLRRNQMKLRRNRFVPTWRIKNIHVENRKSPRGYSVLWSQLIRIRHPKVFPAPQNRN